MTYVYDRSKTFSFIIVFSTVVFSSRRLVFLLNLEVSTRNDMGDILKFERRELRYVDREILNTLKVCFIQRHY